MFIMIDGIDGSGKDTIIAAFKEHLSAAGHTLFTVVDHWKTHQSYPAVNDLLAADVIVTAEPTYVGIGKVIREELIKNGNGYSNLAHAHAYSLDRLVHYKKIVIPALDAHKHVIQVRGVSSSLCYQSLSGELTLEQIAGLPGNALALERHPDHLVLLDLSVDEAMQRVGGRLQKNDDAVFEKRDIMDKSHTFYHSDAFRQLFENHGTTVHYLPVNQDIATMTSKAVAFLKNLINA